MTFNALILARKALDLFAGEAAPETDVELARELVEELGEQLDIEEEDGGRGELGGDDVQEDFGAEDLGVARGFGRGREVRGAGRGFEGAEAGGEEGGAGLEKGCFFTCLVEGRRLVCVCVLNGGWMMVSCGGDDWKRRTYLFARVRC